MTKRKGIPPHPRLRQISHHLTWQLGTRFPKAIPLVFIVGYPKSGTTWASQLIADYLRIPFPQFSLLPIGCEAVVQGHQRVWKSYPRGVYVLRDGRDVMASKYFQIARQIPDGDHPRMTRWQRRQLPGLVNKASVSDNIARFVETQMKRPDSARVNWSDHARSYFEVNHPRFTLVRYEDLLHDGEATLAGAVAKLTSEEADLDRVRTTLEKFAFRRLAGRSRGVEDRSSFLRKGKAGDWTNHFTVEAAEIFDHYCGDMLIKAGYESDRLWVRTFADDTADPPAVGTAQAAEGRP